MEKLEFWIGVNDYPLYRFNDESSARQKLSELSKAVPDADFSVFKLSVVKI